jgi:glycosyltransferase involved in cell wall biosynthesis
MDVFTFPSRTLPYGNVVLEALASGVPAVVTNEGGAMFIIRNGETGFAASDVREFSAAVGRIATDASLLARMRLAGRPRRWKAGTALLRSWSSTR